MSRPALTVAWMPSRLVYFPDEIRTTSLMPRAPCGSGPARESGLGLAAKAVPTAKRFYSRPQQGTQHGFTLVELVMVIAIAGLVAVLISTVMSNPLQSFVDQSRRAELVDKASMALNRMARDIRLAVPNSLRIGSSGELELLRGPFGGRYRANMVGGVSQDPPVCDSNPCLIPTPGPLDLSLVDLTQPLWMVIYNVGNAGAGNNTWPSLDAESSVISPPVTVSVVSTAPSPSGPVAGLSLAGSGINSFRFRYASPQHRFYLADKVVGYRCAGSKLLRGEFTTLQLAGTYDYSSAATVVDQVDCSNSGFTYYPGTNTRSGLATLRLTLKQTQGQNVETITLLQQVHVDNAP